MVVLVIEIGKQINNYYILELLLHYCFSNYNQWIYNH